MYSNKILYISLIMTIILGACHKELLEPVPESTLTTSNFYKTAKDMNMAVLGIYGRLQYRKGRIYEDDKDRTFMEIPSDNIYFGTWAAPYRDIDNWEMLSNSSGVEFFWIQSYNGIFLANNVLENINTPTNYGTGEKEQYIGEAKFMRALFYFDLVRVYGGVPLINKPVTIEQCKMIPRASEEEIYNLIVEDLNDAVSQLPEQSIASGRTSRAAAIGLLAKVYVYRNDWTNAKTNLERLFSEYSYSLEANVKDVILKPKNNELIFVVAYTSGTYGQFLTRDYLPYTGVYGVMQNGGNVCVSWDLIKRFHPADSRKEAWIQELWKPYNAKPEDQPIFWPYGIKYFDPAKVNVSSSVGVGIDLPVLRLGDMILLYAETLYELNQHDEALVQLNRIRERAFKGTGHNYTLADIPTREDWIQLLFLERRLELCFEHDRWFDLVRSGLYMDLNEYETYNDGAGTILVKKLEPKPWKKYFPIPQAQIDLYPSGFLIQNEGY